MKTKSRSGSPRTATKATAKVKTKATPADATSAKVIWLNTEKEHRRLYATVNKKDGRLVCYLDRNCVMEFSPFRDSKFPPFQPEQVQTITIAEKLNGVHFIYTKSGGCWGGYLLKRGYFPKEQKAFIPKDADETPIEKKSSRKQIERNRDAAKKRALIDDDYAGLIIAEWDFMSKTLSDRRKSDIIAQRCASGEWKHNPKANTIVDRKDGDPVTARNVLDFIKRHST